MRNSRKILLFFLLFLLPSTGKLHAVERMDFAVIQPGQPGTSQEAQPVMDSLATYVQKKMTLSSGAKGQYFNDLDQAMAFMRDGSPQWGIVSLGFFLENADRFPMIPIASTRPGGFEKETWSLVTGKNGPEDWHLLQGNVQGTMLYEKIAVSCILFGQSWENLGFQLVGTFLPLKSLRATARGKEAGVVLDRLQYEAMKNLPLRQDLKTVLASREIPTNPVVWFGRRSGQMDELGAILVGMRDDPAAAGLLKSLQTDGFGPPDPALSALRQNVPENCAP